MKERYKYPTILTAKVAITIARIAAATKIDINVCSEAGLFTNKQTKTVDVKTITTDIIPPIINHCVFDMVDQKFFIFLHLSPYQIVNLLFLFFNLSCIIYP